MPQSDEVAGILEQSQGEAVADSEGRVGSEDQSSVKTGNMNRPGPTRKRRLDKGIWQRKSKM